MPVVIPKSGKGQVKIATIADLTFVRAMSALNAKYGPLYQTKNSIKKRMRAGGVKFAQSEYVIADLRGGEDKEPKKFVDPRRLLALLKEKYPDDWEQKFLDVLCVRTTLLPPILSGNEIETLLEPAKDDHGNVDHGEAGGSLFTDWKPGVKFDAEVVEASMLLAIQKINEAPMEDGRTKRARGRAA